MVNSSNSCMTRGASAVQKERAVLPTDADERSSRARMSQQKEIVSNTVGFLSERGGLADESELIAPLALANPAAYLHEQQRQDSWSAIQPADPPEQPEMLEIEMRAMSEEELEQMSGGGGEDKSSRSETNSMSLKDFEKLGLLGTGGAAVVYLVRHRATQQVFAMKVQQISPAEPQNRQTQRALRELQILKALQHPFVARLHDAFQDGANLCLVMEFYDGGNLKDVQGFCGGKIDEEEAKFYASEIVLALEYVHTMGFVYRDLKPQNVLLHKDGHVRLTDFGVAQHGDHIGAGASSTNNGSISNGAQSHYGADDRVRLRSTSFVGTMDYMPPEMIQQKAQSTDVDWWSLGCLVYELIYGTPPFRYQGSESIHLSQDNQDGGANDPATLFKEILRCRVQFPAEPKVSDECKDFLRKLIEKDPEKRLGHRFGAGEVKQHRFFQGTQWALMGNRPAPVVVLQAGTTTSSPCFQRFHPTSLGNSALQELADIEQVLVGTFGSGDWSWVRQPNCDNGYEDEVATKRATLSRTPSTLSNPEDTCDEELDQVLLLEACQVCARDKLFCSTTNYQRSSRFETRTLSRSSPFIATMLMRRGSCRQAAAASSLPTSSSFNARALRSGIDEAPDANPATLLKKNAWTILTDKAAAFLS